MLAVICAKNRITNPIRRSAMSCESIVWWWGGGERGVGKWEWRGVVGGGVVVEVGGVVVDGGW